MNFDRMKNEKWYYDETKGVEVFCDPQEVDVYDRRMNPMRNYNEEEAEICEKAGNNHGRHHSGNWNRNRRNGLPVIKTLCQCCGN